MKVKTKTTSITQSRLVECRVCKLSIGGIPIIKVVVLSRPLFDLCVNDKSKFSLNYKSIFCRFIFLKLFS